MEFIIQVVKVPLLMLHEMDCSGFSMLIFNYLLSAKANHLAAWFTREASLIVCTILDWFTVNKGPTGIQFLNLA